MYIAANSYHSSQADLQAALACSQAEQPSRIANQACIWRQGRTREAAALAGASSTTPLAPNARGTKLALMRGVLVFTNMYMSGLVN